MISAIINNAIPLELWLKEFFPQCNKDMYDAIIEAALGTEYRRTICGVDILYVPTNNDSTGKLIVYDTNSQKTAILNISCREVDLDSMAPKADHDIIVLGENDDELGELFDVLVGKCGLNHLMACDIEMVIRDAIALNNPISNMEIFYDRGSVTICELTSNNFGFWFFKMHVYYRTDGITRDATYCMYIKDKGI